jgi:hypothetical protein
VFNLRSQRLYEVLTKGGLELVIAHLHRSRQKWFQNVQDFGIELSLIALCLCPGGPARLIVITLLLREQEQNLKEASLLLEDQKDLVLRIFTISSFFSSFTSQSRTRAHIRVFLSLWDFKHVPGGGPRSNEAYSASPSYRASGRAGR